MGLVASTTARDHYSRTVLYSRYDQQSVQLLGTTLYMFFADFEQQEEPRRAQKTTVVVCMSFYSIL